MIYKENQGEFIQVSLNIKLFFVAVDNFIK